MRTLKLFTFLFTLSFIFACNNSPDSKEEPEPDLRCAIPTKDLYMVGEIGSECVLIEMEQNNHSLRAVEDFIIMVIASFTSTIDHNLSYDILFTIPYNGDACPELSPDAIKVGKYKLYRGNYFNEPGLAGFRMYTAIDMLLSWDEFIEQDANAFFEITSVEDVPLTSKYYGMTYQKRISGKLNCKIKSFPIDDPPLDIKDLEFVAEVAY